MKVYNETTEMLHDALNALVKKRDLSSGGLEAVSKVVDTLKDLKELEMLDKGEGHSHRMMGGMSRMGNSYDDGYSENYSERMGGNSYGNEGYSERRGGGRGGRGSSRDGDSSYGNDGYSMRGGYSYGNPKAEMMEQLEEMMDKASPHQLKDIQKCMDTLRSL